MATVAQLDNAVREAHELARGSAIPGCQKSSCENIPAIIHAVENDVGEMVAPGATSFFPD